MWVWYHFAYSLLSDNRSLRFCALTSVDALFIFWRFYIMAYCTKCGALLQDGAKFCGGCGVSIENPQVDNGRKSVWDGEMHKCPQCGEVLNSFTAKCPSCGYELRGAETTNSLLRFSNQLADIERRRENQSWKSFLQQKLSGKRLSPIDEEKINLIQIHLIII